MEQLKYPIGRFQVPSDINEQVISTGIESIKQLPIVLNEKVVNLTDEQLDLTYREEGWSIRQLVHHIADSHMNSLIRFKLALTEDAPTIKPYDEVQWALLPDSHIAIHSSLRIIEGVHERWTTLLQSLKHDDYSRVFIHPELGQVPLSTALFLYVWHGNHHLAHIDLAIQPK
ncbi:YfiT family bacillithiol transferase [Bacillus sp. AK128]